jgi:hypothetical protein
MAPLAPDEWEAPRGFEPVQSASLRGGRSRAQAPWSAQPEGFAPDYPDGLAREDGLLGSLRLQVHPAALLRRGRALGRWLQAHKLVATAGLSLVLMSGIALAQLAARPGASRLTTLGAVPATVTLSCSSRPTRVTLTNSGKQSLTWQAEPLAGLSMVPTQGTLQPGQSAELRIAALGRKPGSGAIVIAAADGTLSIPYTIMCR